MNIENTLTQLGLDEKEVSVYVNCLRHGPSSPTELESYSKVKRTTVYEVAKSLKKQGLLTEQLKGKRRLFTAAHPEILRAKLEERLEVFNSILPELKAFLVGTPNKPQVKVFEGEDELKNMYEDTLRYPGSTFYSFLGTSNADKKLIQYLTNHYLRKRKMKNISFKVIATNTKDGQKYKESDSTNLRETKLISADDYPFSIEILIYEGKVAFISYKETEMFGLLVESNEIYSTMKGIFQFFWKHA